MCYNNKTKYKKNNKTRINNNNSTLLILYVIPPWLLQARCSSLTLWSVTPWCWTRKSCPRRCLTRRRWTSTWRASASQTKTLMGWWQYTWVCWSPSLRWDWSYPGVNSWVFSPLRGGRLRPTFDDTPTLSPLRGRRETTPQTKVGVTLWGSEEEGSLPSKIVWNNCTETKQLN